MREWESQIAARSILLPTVCLRSAGSLAKRTHGARPAAFGVIVGQFSCLNT
ncbi:expressed unknown protein [Ectocarpus siliculosus]|uniref:Uncharacterized protein n=1 Tax=Ectocarpus siliculosus TaxID=2880 RepID=D7FH39_ECTSI|nr:expressed unknown protein [Ectocarpus siliculosus]|eukprot:CBJ28414.1 expressed unknown protein [Ectocarpus siliculosus]